MSRSSEAPGAVPVAPHLLTVEEAAAYLSVPPHWLADAARNRRIRCTRLGRRIRFRVEHLEEFIAANEQPVTAPLASPRSLQPVPASRRRGARSRL